MFAVPQRLTTERGLQNYKEHVSKQKDWKVGHASILDKIVNIQNSSFLEGTPVEWETSLGEPIKFRAWWINNTWHSNENCKDGLVLADKEPFAAGGEKKCFRGVLQAHERMFFVAVLTTKNGTTTAFNVYCETIQKPLQGTVPTFAIKKQEALFSDITQRDEIIFIQQYYPLTLFNLMEHTDTPLNEITRHIIGVKLLEALSQLHRKGYMHADLKPENVLLMTTPPPPREGTYQEIAEHLNKWAESIQISFCDLDALSKEECPLLYYTPGYASPEKIRLKRTSFKDDVFSAGLILIGLYQLRFLMDWVNQTKEELKKSLKKYNDEKSFDPFSRLPQTEKMKVIRKLVDRDPANRLDAATALNEWIKITPAIPSEPILHTKSDVSPFAHPSKTPLVNDGKSVEKSKALEQTSDDLSHPCEIAPVASERITVPSKIRDPCLGITFSFDGLHSKVRICVYQITKNRRYKIKEKSKTKKELDYETFCRLVGIKQTPLDKVMLTRIRKSFIGFLHPKQRVCLALDK